MANLSNINGKFVVEQTTGYVGVGTTDPSYPIEVLNSSAEIALNASGASIYRLRSDSTDAFRINKNGVGDRLVILGGGDIGIGISAPTTKLHIGGTAPGDSIIRQDSTVSGTNWEIGERAAGKWQIFEDDGDTIVATFMSTGNVGIGTDSPSEILHLNEDGGTGCFIRFQNTGGSGVYIGGRSEIMEMYTNGSEKMRITSAGNVGIGTQSPDSYNLGSTGKTLAINSTSASVGSLLNMETAGVKRGYLFANASNVVLSAVHTGIPLKFNTEDTTALTIDSDQNSTFAGNIYSGLNGMMEFRSSSYNNRQIGIDSQGFYVFNPVAVSGGRYDLKINDSGNATFAGNVQAPSVLANSFMEIRSDTAALYFENAANNNYYRFSRTSNDLYLDYYNGSSTTTYTIVSAAGEFWSKALFAGSGTGYRRTYLQEGGFRCTSSADEASTLDIAVNNTKTSIYSNYYSGGSNNDICISTYPPSQNQLYLKNTGNVGIGTDSPAQKLHVLASNHMVTFENTSATANTYTQMLLKAGTAHGYIWTANQNSTNWGGPNSLNIYAQEAGAIAFYTTSVKRMTITSAGGMSFGATGTAYGTSGQVLTSNGNAPPTWQAAGGSSPWTTSGNNIYYTTGNVSIGTSSTSFSSSYDNLIVGTGSGDNGIGIYSGTTSNSTLAFLASTGGQSDFEIRVEHDAPFGNMEVYFVKGGNDKYLRMFERNNGQDPMIKVGNNSIPQGLNTGDDAIMQFRPENSNWYPAIAINAEDSQGNNRGFIEMKSNRSSSSSADYFLKFFNYNSNEIGSIRVNNNNNNVAYNTSSDYRLKEDLKEFKALDTVCKIKVYNYTWKDDPSDFRDQGILAHELDELIPQAVSGEKDALDKDDNILPQSVDYSKIVPHLVQSIQELKAEIEILKNK